MSEPHLGPTETFHRVIDLGIRLVLVGGLIAWSLFILKPFLVPVIWGAIIAVAAHPMYVWLLRGVGGRTKLAASLFTLLMVVALLIPTVLLGNTLVDGALLFADRFEAGELGVPAPPDHVAEWPVVGPAIFELWHLASEDAFAAFERFRPQLEAARDGLMTIAANAGFGVLKLVLSIILAGVFLSQAEPGAEMTRAIATRLAGERGVAFADLSRDTVRSVARGILGVAVLQGVLGGLGCLVVGVPAAGLWALLILILAVVQLSPMIVLLPISIYVFSFHETLPAVLFAVWSLAVSLMDGFLKPMLLGRGVDAPMVVVFLGAIGGMLSSGVIGLFVGPVVLVLVYTLYTAWMKEEQERTSLVPPPPAAGTEGPEPEDSS